MTFSIVAFDSETRELGVAVSSKFPAVGSLVPWISMDAGAIATQALADLKYGVNGLKLLQAGASASQVLRVINEQDPGKESRQVGIVDLNGNSVSFTGKECYPYAGGLTGEGVAVQGNILAGEEVINNMMDTYLKKQGDLSERLMSALEAGQKAGGDSRGQQSANLLVYKKNGGYRGGSDIYVDVRVDDHPNATYELRKVFELYSLTLLQRDDPKNISRLDAELLEKITDKLYEIKFLKSPITEEEARLPAFVQWIHTENFENKERFDGYVWNSVLDHLWKL